LYLNGGFGFGHDYEHCSKFSTFLRNSLTEVGLLINEEENLSASAVMQWNNGFVKPGAYKTFWVCTL
jgi:hypothetical protein